MDKETIQSLKAIEDIINDNIDKLIVKRDNAIDSEKYLYRYTTRKLEEALGAIHKAQDKINEKHVDFKLTD